MNIVRLFAMGVGAVLLLVMLEGFRRLIIGTGLPRWKVVVFMAGNAVGYYLTMYGIRELLSGRRMGVTAVSCILIGIGIDYIVARETWPAMAKKKSELLVRTHTVRLVELLAFVLLALLLVIILMLSGRSDYPYSEFPW
jgi:hypothetical protein